MTTAWDDEIVLRRASIDDARRELVAGEMSHSAFAAVEAREVAAIDRCEQLRRSAVATPGAGVASPLRHHRRRYLVIALVCFGVVIAAVLASTLGVRQPGNSITGGVGGSTSQTVVRLLAQAEIDQLSNRPASALVAYNQVLVLDQSNLEALTQSGWLSFSAGSAARQLALVRLGEQRVAVAVATHPLDAAARLYYAIIASTLPGKQKVAAAQFKIFLGLHPSATLRTIAGPWLTRYGLFHPR